MSLKKESGVHTSGSLHESYSHDEEVQGSSDRAFGLTVGGILAALGLIRWLLGSGFGIATAILLAIGGALALAGWLAPAHLAPLNRAWTKLGLFLFKIVNPIVMFLIYAITIVPIGLIMRMQGKDLLRLKRDEAAQSYWIDRQPSGPEPKSMINQF